MRSLKVGIACWAVYNYDDAVQTIDGPTFATEKVSAGVPGLYADHRG